MVFPGTNPQVYLLWNARGSSEMGCAGSFNNKRAAPLKPT